MNEYEVKNYQELENGVTTTNTFNNETDDSKDKLEEAKTILNDTSVFMGPVQEECIAELTALDSDVSTLQSEFTTMGNYLSNATDTYKTGDSQAASLVQRNTVGKAASSVKIPSNIVQAGYTVTCYGEGGWYLGGGSTPTAVANGTKQKSVHEAWLADGARYKNGIAVMNVNGQDHYLIATAPTLGTVGDSVNVNLANGQTIPCVIADAKSTHDSNYTTYGHGRSDGSVNILEFEVDRNKYNSSGNPSTNSWGLEWDSSSNVSSVDNYGSIV